MKLIVGLGNPGDEYKNSRHNLGFMVLDNYVSSIMYQVLWEDNKKLKSQIIKTDKAIFVKPKTFMNNSGEAVKLLTTYYKLPTTDLIVVYDELDLPLGKIRARTGGGAAGHHGVESVIEILGTDQFKRIRLGIGPAKGSPEKFVLEPFMPSEKTKVKKMIQEAVSAIDNFVISPLD